MESHENDQYVTFPITAMHSGMQANVNIISHEEICEPVPECIIHENLTEATNENMELPETEGAVEILTEHSEEEDNNANYSNNDVFVKQEEPQQYMSGDDETTAVEALRQLGGMYPNFDNKKINCSYCGNSVAGSMLEKHQSLCLSGKFICDICGEKFEKKIDFNNHMVCHQVDRPHACRTCGNLFRTKSNLQEHMLEVHQAGRPHKCNICGADFQRPSSLSNHMKIHTYVAGRAIAQIQSNVPQSTETLRKWPDNVSESQIPASISTIQEYDDSRVQWAVPVYSFPNDQSNTNSLEEENIDTLQEFTVMPNGEATQFEYTQSTATNSINRHQYISLNSFDSTESESKIESVHYTNSSNETLKKLDQVESNDDEKTHICSYCGKGFSRRLALTTHEKIHIKNWPVPIECEYCDKQFQDNNYLATHQRTCAKRMMQASLEQGIPNNKWGKHACSECGKKFTTKQKMFRHQWIHRKKTHSCEVCGLQFEKQQELDEHRLAAHPGDSPFTCGECGKSFVSRQGLWEHGRTHAGSPAHFQCDTCSKTFSSRQGYLIHHRTHTGERPYGCKFCWKSFRDGGTLRKHERIHTGERPHVCPLCSRAFNQKVVLREHVRWVHAAGKNETDATGPPFSCPLCGAINHDRDELCAHIVKHSDQMIAEAKAKINNNTPKQKAQKRKPKTMLIDSQTKKSATEKGSVSQFKQEQVFITVADAINNQNVILEKQNSTLLFIPTEKCNELHVISDVKQNNMQFVTNSKTVDMQVNDNDEDGIHFMGRLENTGKQINQQTKQKKEDNDEIVQMTSLSKQNNTLHLIPKDDNASPSAINSNLQNTEDFSSQLTPMINGPMNSVTHNAPSVDQNVKHRSGNEGTQNNKHTLKTTVIHVIQYHHENSDSGEELVCGICGEDFNNKNVLMEHVKIHM